MKGFFIYTGPVEEGSSFTEVPAKGNRRNMEGFSKEVQENKRIYSSKDIKENERI